MEKIAVIGSVGVPANYGGFETLVHRLIMQLSDQFSLSVYCSGRHYKKHKRQKNWHNARLYFLPLKANGIQSIPYDIFSIIHSLFYANTLLVLGVSGGIFLPLVKWFTRKKIIVNIDGMEWRRTKWNPVIRTFLKISERLAVYAADAVVTDNKVIKEYVKQRYKIKGQLIAYGGDHVQSVLLIDEYVNEYSFLATSYACKVCRIEPENNVGLILAAFSEMPEKNLVVIGNWENSPYGSDLRARYKKYSNLYLLDPIYEQQKLDVIRSNCSLYIHGHSVGGTNPSLVEAMCLGLAVIAFDVNFNRATTMQKAQYFATKKELIRLVSTLGKPQRNKLAEEMYELGNTLYSWENIARQYNTLFKAVRMQDCKKLNSPIRLKETYATLN